MYFWSLIFPEYQNYINITVYLLTFIFIMNFLITFDIRPIIPFVSDKTIVLFSLFVFLIILLLFPCHFLVIALLLNIDNVLQCIQVKQWSKEKSLKMVKW